jgi:hypothetical protein
MHASLYLQLDKPARELDQPVLVEKMTGFIETETYKPGSIL